MYKQKNLSDGTLDTEIILKIDGEKIIHIPTDEANTDYQEYLDWIAEGNTPEPADEV